MDELSLAVENLDEVAPSASDSVVLYGAVGDEDDGEGFPSTPGLIKPFSEYSATECLLLFILLWLILQFVLRVVKEGFYWLQ